ncbi:MAG: hypothetical protein JJ971_15170 [Balneolaceae bacterium]|nr:hypothetical protein [Balneolaceae bacterium]MBO6547740.1 hypothetical protein [Balneolaceae bacterium]MBO6648251.1 hypothetical protein [Balneolaceae bacterium]
MNKSLYDPSDSPTLKERELMWENISESLDVNPKPTIHNLHWRSFWIGNAAAILVAFALIGVFNTADTFLDGNQVSGEDQMYETLTSATNQLRNLPPLLIDQASEPKKSSLESTVMAIEEIDRLIEEIKHDILINGETPIKQQNLKRLYATKLDFYKDLLLNEDNQS